MRLFATVLVFAALTTGAFAASSLVPAITNAGFEEVAPNDAAPGWNWLCSAQAGYRTETNNPHSGSRCLVISNQSGFQPNVYGRLRQTISVAPNTEYELSVWVRGVDVKSEGDICHFSDWGTYRLNLPTGTFDWQKTSTTFKTKPDQTTLEIGVNAVNSCKELALDDIAVRPVGTLFKGNGVTGSFVVLGQVSGDNKPAPLTIFVTSTLSADAKLEAVIKSNKTVLFKQSVPVKPGENSFDWTWNTGKTDERKLDLTLRVMDAKGKIIASGSQQITKQSPMVLLGEINHIQSRLNNQFGSLYNKCRAKNIPLDYPNTTKALLEQFIPIARHDAVTGEDWRAEYAIRDLNRSLDESIMLMQACLKDPKLAPITKRYQTGKLDIKGLSVIGDRKDSKGKIDRGPLFFCGYGHFGQVRRDMSRWPGYGVNIIQSAEFGPAQVFTTETEVSLDLIKEIAKSFDDAAKNNVKIDLLLSPHYFPEWALKKWPQIKKGGGNFFEYCVDAQEAKALEEKFLRLVIQIFKNKPALNSFCLSNEPTFDRTAGCGNTAQMWAEYLAKVHGDVKTMNERYGTNYTRFEDVPNPGNNNYDVPQFHDYVIFNQERFANWHKWMADVIHEMAPDIPVHAKLQSWMTLQRLTVAWGTNPEMFCEFSQLAGNDCGSYPGSGDSGISWGGQSIWYDLLRSLGGKPIFNSENHFQPDFSTYYVAPEHYRATLWLGAVHGQAMTTAWAWEHTHDRSSCIYGNVMDRPGCAQAIGTTCLDLNRFAEEMTAIQNTPAPVAVLYSTASIAKTEPFMGTMHQAYFSLCFNGVKIDFISDKQLAAGKGANYKMVVLPDAIFLPTATFQALRNLPKETRIVVLGQSPQKDSYGNALPADDVRAIQERALTIPTNADCAKILRTELAKVGGLPEISVVDAKTGEPMREVEWLPAKLGGRTIINIVNLRSAPVEVKILAKGKQIIARDLLSLGGRENVRLLKPVIPVLAEIAL